jgi:MoxR-like ATPase
LDRFFFQINIGYPTHEQEKTIITQTTGAYEPKLNKVLSAEDILNLQEIVRKVPVSDFCVDYAVRLTRASRPNENEAPDFVKQFVSWGAGPRGAQALILGSKARAILNGRYSVSVEDIKAIAFTCLRHRVLINFHGEAEGITSEEVIKRLLEKIPAE